MTPLEDRLREVEGVADLMVDLEHEGVRISLQDGVDEQTVLEEVRRILAAYGLRPGERAAVPTVERPGPPGRMVLEMPAVSVRRVADEAEVRLEAGERVVVARSDPSAAGITEAMVTAVSGWIDVPAPDRVSVGRTRVGGAPVVVVVVHRADTAAAGAGMAAPSLADGLYRASRAAVESLYR
jgi:hypothetical protein